MPAGKGYPKVVGQRGSGPEVLTIGVGRQRGRFAGRGSEKLNVEVERDAEGKFAMQGAAPETASWEERTKGMTTKERVALWEKEQEKLHPREEKPKATMPDTPVVSDMERKQAEKNRSTFQAKFESVSDMSPSALQASAPDGFRYREGHRAEASREDGVTVVGQKFFQLRRDGRINALWHELGHDLEEEMGVDLQFRLKDAGAFRGVFGESEIEGIGDPRPQESVANVFAEIMTGNKRWVADHYRSAGYFEAISLKFIAKGSPR